MTESPGGAMVYVEMVETAELGDRSYVVHDGKTAVVVDAQRDTDRFHQVISAAGVDVAAVAETHIHNDYVTGGLVLADSAGADYLVNVADDVAFERRGIRDGDVLTYGSLRVQAIATPGHTYNHLAYVVSSTNGDEGSAALFTGGSMVYGGVGRTDLLGPANTDELTRAQFHTVRRLVSMLPEETKVYPTHGFGSFCSAGVTTRIDVSTLGAEKRRNDALTEDDEDAFAEHLIAGLTAYPGYYVHMNARNLAGPGPADLSPPEPIDPRELRSRIDAGEWVVDLRNRRMYCAQHIAGTIAVELGQQFATYLGWLFPWGGALTLIGASAEQVATAQRQLVRIGIDRPTGAAVGDIAGLSSGGAIRSYPYVDFTEVQQRLARQPLGDDSHPDGDDIQVLDVRRDDERAQSAIPGSVHTPLHLLPSSLDSQPAGTLWVHCGSGYRASIAASLLARAGRDVVLIDDDYSHAQQLGLTADRP